jgi:hypothetical protein
VMLNRVLVKLLLVQVRLIAAMVKLCVVMAMFYVLRSR